jgi:hypothetical protein
MAGMLGSYKAGKLITVVSLQASRLSSLPVQNMIDMLGIF